MLSVPKLDFRSCFVQNKYIYGEANGNMTKDNNKNINSISYNHLNLPTSVIFADDRSIRYTYDATGVKLKKEIFLSLPDLFNPVANTTTYYAGNYIYEKDGSGESLKFFSHPEGYIEKNGAVFDYVYQYKDHLGNIRLSYQDMNNNGSVDNTEIKEENNYYPFGLEHKGYGAPRISNHPYKFGGKEFNQELGLDWYDVSARNYDPALGRWMNIDPLAETPENIAYSPYSYVWNNPLRYIDPDGRTGQDVILRGSQLDIDRTTRLIEKETAGQYTASVDVNGQLSLTATNVSGPGMSEKGMAVVSELQSLIMSKTVTEVDVVSGDAKVDVGSLENNAIDIADIEEFDKKGSIGRLSVGALVHELVEQQAKVEGGVVKGVQPIPIKAESMHQKGIKAANSVDNNRRYFNNDQDFYMESNGEVTHERWFNSTNGIINIKKINNGKPPAGFKERK